MALFSIENEDCRSCLSVALSEKLGETVTIKPKRHFWSRDIEVDGVVKMVSSSKFESNGRGKYGNAIISPDLCRIPHRHPVNANVVRTSVTFLLPY